MESFRITSALMTAVLMLGAALVATIYGTQSAQAQTFLTLYTFTGRSDGGYPGGLIFDGAGTLVGTTCGTCTAGLGIVYKLNKNGLTVLHSFTGADGYSPVGPLLRDASGNLYGTASYGGAYGYGTAYKLDTAGNLTVLHGFTGADGANPGAGFIRGTGVNGYSTTPVGGAYGYGTVYELDTAGNFTLLHSFTGGSDGASPWARMLRDAAGNLYGTASAGGDSGRGVVFKLDSAGTFSVVHTFTGPDGSGPYGSLIADAEGNLYGTTWSGGAHGGGTVFKLDTAGTETVLYSFCSQPGCTDGASPQAGVTRDAAGNLYGTTNFDGADGDYGTVFKLDTAGNLTVLHSFTNADGDVPNTGVTRDAAGNLYGTTYYGGAYGKGTVFEIKP